MLGHRLCALLLLFLVGSTTANGYVRTVSSNGRPLFWANPSITLLGNPINSSGLSEAQVNTLFSNAFSSWQVAGTSVSFAYSQSTGHPLSSGQDGANSVYFTSASGRALEWGVVAVTEVLYYVSSGRIAEADMIYNDQQFRFTANAGDTGQSIGGRTAIYLPDVATHEAGHVIGLDHSLVNLSSMIYTAFSGQFALGSDDGSGARTLYPSGGRTGGNLTGTVAGTQGGIFGAQVSAVNLSTGKVEAGALTASDGSFTLGDVPAGKYAVLMEPFGADISSVSSYFQNIDHRFCSGSRFRRRFYSSCGNDGLASVVEVSAGASASLGTLTPSCAAMGNPGGPPSSIAFAREIASTGGAAFGTLRTNENHYYRVRNASGLLSARAHSFTLYSPVDLRVQILDSAGNALPGATSVDNVESPMPGGKINYDSTASANVANGDYLVKVTSSATRIPSSAFSAGWELMDNDGHYLLSLGVNGDFSASAPTDMSACATVRNTPQSASFRELASTKNEDDRSSGCGMIHSGGGPFSGGMMQVLLLAIAKQLAILYSRQRPSLVRNRR